jgi:hypothetical protein
MTGPEPMPAVPARPVAQSRDGSALIGRPPTAPTPVEAPAPPVPRSGPLPAPPPPLAPQLAPPLAPPLAAPAVATGGFTTVARPATQAAVIAAAATVAAPSQLAEAVAIPDAGGPPPSTQDGHRPSNGRGHRGLTGRLARLRIGSHTVSRPALAQLRVTSLGAGLILGADRQQGPVSVRVFRPEPTRVTLVGGPWAAQLVAFRAFALGARVAVITAEPHAWREFGQRATGHGDRVTVIAGQQPLVLAGTAQQPVLVIDDLGMAGVASPQPLGPWQTQLSILRQLHPPGVPLVQECDLVMLQRLGGEEAAVAGKALRLPGPSTQFLQVMADDMVALVADGADRYIWFAQTDVEREYTGGPRR